MVNGSNGLCRTYVDNIISFIITIRVKASLEKKGILKFLEIYKELDQDYLYQLFFQVRITQLLILLLSHGLQDINNDIGLKNFKNLARWYDLISNRDAVKKGYDLLKEEKKSLRPNQ